MPLHGLREIERDPYTAVHHDPTQQLVFIRRSSLPYPSFEELDRSFRRIEQAIRIISRPRSLLLVDARDAPMRNDDGFEVTFGQAHARLFQGFKRAAVILRSAIGVLQVGRLSRGYVTPVSTFTRPEDALLHLGVRVDLTQLKSP
ncbi:hypothetical protein [Sorangium cellulosum]|uniref:hypothetical protein n=1 Tax=Sorangium cellulosum TaxID=56 RepID=UPI000AEA6B16|nr:hypothetical protein [Sorangium cellulosum]